MQSEFSFDDSTNNLLKQSKPKEEKKTIKIQAYLTESENRELLALLDDRPVSVMIRKIVLEWMNNKRG